MSSEMTNLVPSLSLPRPCPCPCPHPCPRSFASSLSLLSCSCSLCLCLLALSHRSPRGSLPSGVHELIPVKAPERTATQLASTMMTSAMRGNSSWVLRRDASAASLFLSPFLALRMAFFWYLSSLGTGGCEDEDED